MLGSPLYIVQRIPAWGKTLNSRSTQKPKLHLVDSGLLSHLSRITVEKMLSKNVTALSDYGHIFETFIVGELLRLAELRDDFIHAGALIYQGEHTYRHADRIFAIPADRLWK